MVLIGRQFWTETIPCYDLLKHISRKKPYGKLVHLVDEPEEAVEAILSFYHMVKPYIRRLSNAPTAKTKVPAKPRNESSLEKQSSLLNL